MPESATWGPNTAFTADVRAINAAAGRSDYIRGGGTAGTLDATTRLIDLGALATGAYVFRLPCGGSAAIDVVLTLGSHTTTVPTATIAPTLADGQTAKVSATNVGTLSDTTQVLTSITTLRGEPYVLLTITVPASSTATFSDGEFSAL